MPPAPGSQELTTNQVQRRAHDHKKELPKAQGRQNPPSQNAGECERCRGEERHFGALLESIPILTECTSRNDTRWSPNCGQGGFRCPKSGNQRDEELCRKHQEASSSETHGGIPSCSAQTRSNKSHRWFCLQTAGDAADLRSGQKMAAAGAPGIGSMNFPPCFNSRWACASSCSFYHLHRLEIRPFVGQPKTVGSGWEAACSCCRWLEKKESHVVFWI